MGNKDETNARYMMKPGKKIKKYTKFID